MIKKCNNKVVSFLILVVCKMYNVYNQSRRVVNIENIREQINRKNRSEPYFATVEHSEQVWTDHDVFPYTRYFRGVPESSIPIVAEREAGWMLRNDAYYRASTISDIWEPPYPNHCFQSACTTVRPCHPKPDRNELHDVYNASCNVQYR
jgi:hypothetical protein